MTNPTQPISGSQALEVLDELEAAARGDGPFNHFAAPLIRGCIKQSIQDAERYRWLRENFSNSHFLDHMSFVIDHEQLGMDEVDEAIDAARLSNQPANADVLPSVKGGE
jgi:hypothetical protein